MGNKPFKPENDAERELADAVARAGVATFSGRLDDQRTVRGEFVRALLLGLVEGGDLPPGPVRTVALRIDGHLDLHGCGDDARPLPALMLPFVQIDGTLNLRSATIGALEMPFAHVKSFIGSSADIEGDIHANDVVVGDGRIVLSNARINGSVRLSRAAARDDAPLMAVELGAAVIAGDLDLNGIHLANPSAHAVFADGARIGGSVFLRSDGSRRFEAEGEVRFPGCEIGGDLTASGARLCAANSGRSLLVQNARIAGNVFLRPKEDTKQEPVLVRGSPQLFESYGSVNFLSARMENFLAENAIFRAEGDGKALDLDSAKIASDLRMGDRLRKHGIDALSTSRGWIDLTGARVGELEDDGGDGWGPEPVAWPPMEQGGDWTLREGVALKLDGFVYDRLADVQTNTPDKLWRKRRRWLKRLYAGGEPTLATYSPQPYEQLSKTFREAGHEYEARMVAIRKRDIMIQCGAEVPLSRPAKLLFGALFGYGLSPVRTLVTLAVTFSIALLFENGLRDAGVLFVTEAGGPCAATPGLYAFDAILPIVELGYASQCQVSAAAPGLAWAWAGFRVVAWLVVALAALTFSGVLRRD